MSSSPLTELLADLVQLAAQQQLALLLVEAFGHVGADLVLQLEVGQRLAHPREHQLEPRLDLDGLEQLDPLVHGELGRVGRGVGELARVFDPGEHVGDPTGAAVLENRLDHGAVLLGELAGPGRRRSVVELLDLHVQCAVRAQLAVADPAAADAANDEGPGSVRKVAGALDLAIVPTLANRPSTRGTSTIRSPASAAAVPARFASSVSSAIVTTICGSTTPCVRGNRGRS